MLGSMRNRDCISYPGVGTFVLIRPAQTFYERIKVDRNIERQLSYSVDLRKEHRARISLVLRYNNYSGPGSPPCEPQWLNRGAEYGQLKKRMLLELLEGLPSPRSQAA